MAYYIKPRASGDTIYYHVYRPFMLRSDYTTTSVLDAEEWIEKTTFNESPEGLRLARQREIEAREAYKKKLQERADLEEQGWHWDAVRAVFINKSGEIKSEF